MLKIAAHPNGRVFMAGKDGNLYELTYTVAYGFLYSVFFVGDPSGTRKCERVTHKSNGGPSPIHSVLALFGYRNAERTLVDVVVDPLRNVLYTLDLAGNMDLFDLGADGNQTTQKVRDEGLNFVLENGVFRDFSSYFLLLGNGVIRDLWRFLEAAYAVFIAFAYVDGLRGRGEWGWACVIVYPLLFSVVFTFFAESETEDHVLSGYRNAERTLAGIVLDPQRNVRYALDSVGNMNLFDLGADGNQSMQRAR